MLITVVEVVPNVVCVVDVPKSVVEKDVVVDDDSNDGTRFSRLSIKCV